MELLEVSYDMDDYEDRLNDLEARLQNLELLVLKLERQIDNIHPVVYNIVSSEKK